MPDVVCAYCGSKIPTPGTEGSSGVPVALWFCGEAHRAGFLRELGFPRKPGDPPRRDLSAEFDALGEV